MEDKKNSGLTFLDIAILCFMFGVIMGGLLGIKSKLDIIIENMDVKQKVEYVVPITQHTAPIYGISLREGEI